MNHTTRILIATFVVPALLALSACTETSTPAPESHDHDQPETPTDRIDIPPTVRSNLGITFAQVERRRVDSTLRIPGVFELEPLARREYRMILPGEIELAVDQYQPVEPGDLLYRFRSPEWFELQHEIIVAEQDIESASASLNVARARIEQAEQTLSTIRERLSSLTQAQIRNAELETQRDQIESSLTTLRAELNLAQTTLDNAHLTHEHALHRASSVTGIPGKELTQLIEHEGQTVPAYRSFDWVRVYANQSGIVEHLHQTDGAFAESHERVVSIVNTSKLRFRAHALQSDLPRLRTPTTARIIPPNSNAIDPNDAISANVTLGLEANPAQRTVTLIATSEDTRDWIRPGVSAYLEIATDTTGTPALAIPRTAIVKDGIVHVFFRRDPKDPNKAIRVEADLGVDDGYWVEIKSGLSLNDQVVLDGAYELKLASEQNGTTQKGGHFHADGTFHAEED